MDNRNLETFTYSWTFNVLDFLYRYEKIDKQDALLEVNIDFWASLEFERLDDYFIDESGYITHEQYRIVWELDIDGTHSEWIRLNQKFTVELFQSICTQRVMDATTQAWIKITLHDINTNHGITSLKFFCTKASSDFKNDILIYIESLLSNNNTYLSLPEIRRQVWNHIITKSESYKLWVVVFSYSDFVGIFRWDHIHKKQDALDIFSVFIPENPIILFGCYFLITKDLLDFKYDKESLYFSLSPETANYYEWQEWSIRFYQSTGKVFIDDQLLWELPKGSPEYRFFKTLYDKPNYKHTGEELIREMGTWHITQTPEDYLKKIKSNIGRMLSKDILKYIVTENKQYILKT